MTESTRVRELKQIICEAIGEASMCWDPIPSGVFESSMAGEVADRLENAINAELQRRCEAYEKVVDAARELDLDTRMRWWLDNNRAALTDWLHRFDAAIAELDSARSIEQREGEK